MSKLEQIKEASANYKHVYLLVNRRFMEVARMAWGNSLSDAERYFKLGVSENYKRLSYKDFFVVRVMKEPL